MKYWDIDFINGNLSDLDVENREKNYNIEFSNFIKKADSIVKSFVTSISLHDAKIKNILGQHAFIMCIDSTNPKKSIMRDASGHYGI